MSNIYCLPGRAGGSPTELLDPGTGSLVIQFTVGAITGLLVAGRLFGRNLAAFLRGKSKAPHSSGQNDPKRDIQDASVSAEHSDEPVK